MNLQSELLKQPGGPWNSRLCDYVSAHKSRFQELVKIFLHADDSYYRLNQRAVLIILAVEKVQPAWVGEQVGVMAGALKQTLPVAKKRNLLRILQNQVIPREQWGHTVDQCFQYLNSAHEPVAVKVFSMTVLYNLSRVIPEIGRELKYIIEDQFPYGSAGFKARGRKILAALTKDGY